VSAALEDVRTELNARCDAIEECYEYMLAYAAQGVVTEGPQIRGFLQRCDQAITDLIGLSTKFAGTLKTAAAPYAAFMAVVESDARASQAAVQLALAQTVIMSQLVDNLNASIHLRALLTDLFLLDEALK
jgi:hypothetical protein